MVVNDGSPDPFSPQERISNNKILESSKWKICEDEIFDFVYMYHVYDR